MTVMSELSDDQLTIHVEGRFDYSLHQRFRQCYEQLETAPAAYTVDLGKATYMDSSALGMLLLLREHGGGDDAKVRLVNCSPDVRKILTISNFEQLFEID